MGQSISQFAGEQSRHGLFLLTEAEERLYDAIAAWERARDDRRFAQQIEADAVAEVLRCQRVAAHLIPAVKGRCA